MTFLDKLDLLMAELGINKMKLSQLSDVPYTTIDGFYKKGYENAKISTVRKIARALNVSLDYLIEDAESKKGSAPSVSDEALRMAVAFDRASEKDKNTVRQVLAEYTVSPTAATGEEAV